MALEATHIKFALDIQDRYRPSDILAYLSGTIYPDSRYVTGIDRELTHFAELALVDEFERDDVKKGWACHYICDEIMREVMADDFSDILNEDGAQDEWIKRTSLKILVDMDIMRRFSVEPYLGLFDIRPTPNGEDTEKMAHYYKVISRTYEGKQEITLADCMETWRGLNVGVEICDSLAVQSQAYFDDPDMAKRAVQIYPEMFKKVKKNFF